MERLVLPLEAGITGVVGPNGCGKSNIIDALRWVLGETRASNLRGGVLEDIIFNGTDSLRPLGLAEVTITMRASQEGFFADLVSPDLEAELVADGELSTEQEEEAQQPEQASAGSPEEGGSEEAEHPHLRVIDGRLGNQEIVDETGSNGTAAPSSALSAGTLAARFAWLKAATEVQATRRVYRSGESEFFINRIPCRLKDLKDLFRAVGLSARAYTIVAQGEVARIVTSKPEERRMILEEAAGVMGFREKSAAAKRRLDETKNNIARVDDIIKEVTRQVNSLKRQAARARNRAELRDRVKELDLALFKDRVRTHADRLSKTKKDVGQAKEREQACEIGLQRVQATEAAVRGELMSLDVEADAVRARVDALKEELHNRRREREGRRARIGEIEATLRSQAGELLRLKDRAEITNARRVESKNACETIAVQLESLDRQIGALGSGDDSELASVGDHLESLRRELTSCDRERARLREQRMAEAGRAETLEVQLEEYSLESQLGEALVEVTKQLGGQECQTNEILARLVEVPSDLARAVQAVLGDRSAFVVSSRPHGIARALDSAEGGSRQSIGLLAADDSTEDGPVEFRHPQPSYEDLSYVPFPSLLSLVQPRDGARQVLNEYLGRVFLVDTIEIALDFFEAHHYSSALLVTRGGEVVTRFSFERRGGENGAVQLQARLKELHARIGELDQAIARQTEQGEIFKSQITARQEQQSELLREMQKREAALRELERKASGFRGRFDGEQRRLSQLESDLDRAREEIADTQSRIESGRESINNLEEELAALIPEREIELSQELQKFESRYGELEKARREGRDRFGALAAEVEEERRALDQARAQSSQASLEEQRVSLEVSSLEERITQDYGTEVYRGLIDSAGQAEPLPQAVIQEMKEELEGLRQRIDREGEVDPTSIERYDEERERLDELTAQRADLESAAKTLQESIVRLTETSKQRFRATFDAVNKNFACLVPRLFGGGKGYLTLSDPENPLDSGVEIVARPPGKKLRSIGLLSGGEKALCATALILGMFMERPSPLCVLDEVDAPLDDANLVRFLGLVKEMSTRTQFMIVTHNKQTMATADRLVGVTMQEPGASKVITVSLQEAYSQVA